MTTEDNHHSSRSIPQDFDQIVAAGAALGIVIPDACMAGVIANLALLETHAATLRRDREHSPP